MDFTLSTTSYMIGGSRSRPNTVISRCTNNVVQVWGNNFVNFLRVLLEAVDPIENEYTIY